LFLLWGSARSLEGVNVDLLFCFLVGEDIAVLLHRGVRNGSRAVGSSQDGLLHGSLLDEGARGCTASNHAHDFQAELGVADGEHDVANGHAHTPAAVATHAARLPPFGVPKEERAVAEGLLDAVKGAGLRVPCKDLLDCLLNRVGTALLRLLRIRGLGLGRHFRSCC